MKRFALGLTLIAITSAILLISDWGQRRATATGPIPRIAIVQHASQGILEDGVRGIVDALAEAGYTTPHTAVIRKFNAEGDVSTANAIAREVAGGSFDYVVTVTTMSLQTIANANRAGKLKHIFGLVSDPAGAGVGITRGQPLEHPAHLAGIGTMQPVRETFELARKLNPALKTIGVPWNPAEANSLANITLARQVATEFNLKLLEASAENSSAVADACNALAARGAEAIWVGGDVTALVAIDSVIAAAKRARIPVFTSIPGNTKRGALFDVGADYYEVGRITGNLAAQVLKGAPIATIPIRNVMPETLLFNPDATQGLKNTWTIPADLLARAQAAKAPKPLSKKWKVHILELSNILDVEDSERGLLDGLAAEKLERGRDFDVTIRNAQGDMGVLNGMVDAALGQGAELLLTLSTPTLQAALQRAQGKVPIVFTYVASPVKAGAAKSNEDHAPNVTGVSMVGAYPEMLAVIRKVLPGVKRIGTLFVPAEVNMVFNRDELANAARKEGIELISVGVNQSSEVPDAAQALVGRGLDAIVQIPGNLTATSFSGIVRAASGVKKPIFAFQKAQVKEGATIVLARDYYDAGKHAASLAARVMRGESPARIPIQPFTKTILVVNEEAARKIGLKLPPNLQAGN